jgi:DNA-binding protein H-NS
MSDDICGAETTKGTPCKRKSGSCPWHGDDADAETRKTLLEERPEIKEIIVGELQNNATVPEACSEAGVSKRQYYFWREKADETDKDIFRNFRDETTRARRIASRNDRRDLKEKCKESGDTRTWYKLHHDQYGDTYGEEERESRQTGGQPFGIPDELIEQWQQEA